MKTLTVLFLSLITFQNAFGATPVAPHTTGKGKISQIKVDGGDGIYYFSAAAGTWGTPECKNANYAYLVPTEISDMQAMLSVALSAKMANKAVWFEGECQSDGGYFKIKNIWVE